MQIPKDIKVNYYFNEAGDPQILGRHGVNLIDKGTSSKTFMVGYLECSNPKAVTKALTDLRETLKDDDYLSSIPSFHHSLEMFHANKDCAEVREKVFKLLKAQDITFYCIVARKNESLFREKFGFNQKKIYKYLVSKLLENRLHLYRKIDLYFSAMGSTVRQATMQDAVHDAIDAFNEKWNAENDNEIRVFIQQSSEIPLLQAADYLLWTIQRAYERGDFRYYNYLKDKICLVHDVFDFKKYPKNYYSSKNPLSKEKIDPV